MDQAQAAGAAGAPVPVRYLDQRVEQVGGAAPGGQVMAGRERMAGVQAQPGPRMPVQGVQVGPEIGGGGA
jgi:hypothetical protein